MSFESPFQSKAFCDSRGWSILCGSLAPKATCPTDRVISAASLLYIWD